MRSAVYKVHWDAPEQFPDGALRVRLGDAVAREPELLNAAVGDVLVELGVSPEDLPVSLEAKARWLKSRTHGLRVLLVLEEVVSAAQVEPFLVNSPGSAVVVVSRSMIRELRRFDFEFTKVAPLDEQFGVELFERILGPSWYVASGVVPATLVRACGGYPLAIQTTAAQIEWTPEWEVEDLLRNLEQRGLGALDPESQNEVKDSFDRVYRWISPQAGRAYRLVVGFHPGRLVRLPAAAEMLDVPVETARAALSELTRAHLLTQLDATTYEFHDIGHWHARERAEAEDTQDARTTAVRRVVGWHLAGAIRHDRVLSARPRIGPGYAGAAADVVGRAEALAWLEEHRSGLRDAVALAERFHLDELVWQLCEALWGLFHLHGHHDDWITTHRRGVDAAARLGRPEVLMRMSSQLGAVLLAVGDLDGAEAAFGESERAALAAGDHVGRQSALEWSGKVAARRGDTAAAMDLFGRSWQVAEVDVPAALRPRMFALLQLQCARALLAAGQQADAVPRAGAALAYFEATEEADNIAKSLAVLAKAVADRDEAIPLGRRAAELFRRDGSRRGEADIVEFLLRIDGGSEYRDRLRVVLAEIGDPRADELA